MIVSLTHRSPHDRQDFKLAPHLAHLLRLRHEDLEISFSLKFLSGVGLLTFLGLICEPGTLAVAKTQEKAASAASTQKETLPFTLKIKTGEITSISLKAKDARLKDIAAELSKHLKVPVLLSPLLTKQRVSTEFHDLTLEPALQLLAPQVYVDYQIGTTQQITLGIFLSGYNEPPPAVNSATPGKSQALLIEGDTEEGFEPTSEQAKQRLEAKPLRISYLRHNLTIRAKNQLLTLVVLKVGDELGIPVEIKDESRHLITTDIVDLPLEEALQRLSPNIRLHVRADLQRMERTPLRLVLIAPAPASHGTSMQL